MTFFLPERKEAYALEIPEVFSAYNLYLDHDLILQMGEPAQGTPLVQNRMVTFAWRKTGHTHHSGQQL